MSYAGYAGAAGVEGEFKVPGSRFKVGRSEESSLVGDSTREDPRGSA